MPFKASRHQQASRNCCRTKYAAYISSKHVVLPARQDLRCASVLLCTCIALQTYLTHACLGLCRPILECSKQHLLKLDAVKEGPPGQLSVTDVGRMLTAMPMDIELGLSIVAAVKLGCSEELAIIASMATVAGSRVFARGQSPSASPFAAKSGDHETYLNVFEAWLDNDKDPEWCQQQGLMAVSLEAADELLSKVHQAMGRNKLPALQFSGRARLRSAAIVQSLCSGYFHQLATAADLSSPKKGFWLVDQGQVNPRLASLHRSSVLNAQSGVTMVLFTQATAFADGKQMLCGVSKVEPAWALEAASFNGDTLQGLQQALEAMERTEYSVSLTALPEVSRLWEQKSAYGVHGMQH